MKNIKIKFFIKEFLLIIILAISIFFGLFYYFYFQKNNNIKIYLENLKQQYQTQYNITYDNFDKLSQNSFYGIFNKPEIYNLIKDAYKKDAKTQTYLRNTLYEKIISDYNRLKSLNFRQIHFHFPDNTSFLRMDKSDTYGDDLSQYRFSVNEVNKKLKPLNGFEVGKWAYNFRFVYPLFDEKLFHVGSVEISVNSNAFDSDFERNYNIDSHFLVKKTIVENKMFPESLDLINISYENTDYIYSEDIKKVNAHYVDLNFYSESEKAFISSKMNNSEDFIIYKKNKNKNLAICFLPISNIEGIKNSAYMVIYKDSDFIEQVNHNYYKMIFILILCSLFFIFYLRFKYKQIQEKKNAEFILSQQSKMAAVGEMIENIAHQWRQPLGVISILASGLKLKKECNILDDTEFYYSLDGIVKNTTYLSDTIEDFRNYFNDSLEKKNFNLKNTINQSILMFKEELNAKNIIVIENIDDIELFTYESEIKQVLINILKNSKDFINEGVIIINAHEKNKKIRIDIQDSAGGISQKIIKKIFEPYFTTKHKSVGIGLGLFSSYEIVNNRLKGNIFVENKEFNYNFKTYVGACLSIVLYRDKL